MKKTIISIAASLLMLFTLTGCNTIGDKAANISTIYGVTAALAVILLIGYLLIARKREAWITLLYSAVAVVNVGYFTLSISQTIDMALFANRISYLGSVFLPLAMLMIILNAIKVSYKKWLPITLIIISGIVFLIAASPGYLDIYYKSVSLATVNGATVLIKEYGPWHCLYLYYLVLYFASMIVAISYAAAKKKIDSAMHAVILATAVFLNIVVWLLEQLVYVEFEILSVSYILTEVFLLGLNMMMQENKTVAVAASSESNASTDSETECVAIEPEVPVIDTIPQKEEPTLSQQCSRLMAGLPDLTQTERVLYDYYIEGTTTKEIMETMNITENTLKYHSKNLYGKLGVSSRRQLMKIAKAIKLGEMEDAH